MVSWKLCSFIFLVLKCWFQRQFCRVPRSSFVEVKEHAAHDHLSIPVNTSFHHSISFHRFGQEEGQNILSWSTIQRQFISAFCLHTPKGSRIRKAKFSHLIFGSAFSTCITAWYRKQVSVAIIHSYLCTWVQRKDSRKNILGIWYFINYKWLGMSMWWIGKHSQLIASEPH